MLHATWPSRSYLIGISAKLALAWLVIRLVTSILRNPFLIRVVSVSAWCVAALSIIGQLVSGARGAGFGRHRDRRTAAVAAADPEAGRAAGGGAVARQYRQQFLRRPDQADPRSDAFDSSAADQADADRPDGVRDRADDERGRHQSAGAGGVLRRGRRRHRLRPAEDLRQFHLRRDPAGRQIGQARRSRHHRREFRQDQRDEHPLHLGRRRRRPRIPDPQRGPDHPEGRQLDLHRQEHAGEGRLRHQLRRRSAAGLPARDRRRGRRGAGVKDQAAGLHPRPNSPIRG